MLVLAVAVFFVPLRGLHHRLVEERGRLLAATNARLQTASAALHRLVDQEAGNETDGEASRVAQTRIDALDKALSSLLQERQVVSGLSAWPWDVTTVRAVVTPVLLPIGLFLLTRSLERFLG